MSSHCSLQSVEDVFDHIRKFPLLPAEETALDECLGRILAQPFFAPENLPGFDRATRDGFAVKAKSLLGASENSPALLEYVGECPMGQKPEFQIGPGQAARIWTGGMLPPGANAVARLEHTRPAPDGGLEALRPVARLENVIAANEDARQGEELIAGDRALRPQELGLLAAMGLRSLLVRRRPKVAVISRGDEVVPIERTPAPGQVRDINSHTLAALVRSFGAEARRLGIVDDSHGGLVEKLNEALEWADVVVLSGGSSTGQRDFTARAVSSMEGARVLVNGVSVSPGRTLMAAARGEQSLWALPGHPAGALVCAEVFLRPLLRRLSGLPLESRTAGGKAILSRPIVSKLGRRDFIRVRLGKSGDPEVPLLASPVIGKSGLITALVRADALIVCPESQGGLDAGQIVDLLPGAH